MRPSRRFARRGAAALTVVVAATTLTASAGAPAASAAAAPEQDAVAYRPPVDAELTDTFRPPQTPYGPGNRGIDYATTDGQPVAAAADGEVVFAGRIGTSSHVTVLHDDGIRTTYSFLATTSVRRGNAVRQGEIVGTTTAAGLHFGARAGDAYVDPLVLLGQAAPTEDERQAWLVDDPDPTEPLTEVEERKLVVDTLRTLVNRATDTIGWAADRAAQEARRKAELLRILADDATDLGVPLPVHLAIAAARWRHEQEHGLCTPPETPPKPPTAATRRIAILVGGLGSATGSAAVLDVDTAALGYDEANDVHQFSYNGQDAYGPEHTQGDIAEQGRRLADLITNLQHQHPGTNIDVIAHSQGGLVARSAITTHHAEPATLVTLGTPHQGTDIATAARGLDRTTTGHLLLDGATLATGHATGLDLNSTSILQMAETSDFITHLPEHGWDTTTTHVVSIAARADPVVPNHQSRLDATHAYNTVVTPHGTSTARDHSTLPGSPEATREIRRAIDRQPPTCRTLQETATDTLVGRHTSNTHDSIGAALAAAALYADVRTGAAVSTR